MPELHTGLVFWGLITLVVFILAADVWLLKAGYPTESMVIRDYSRRLNFIPFVCGLLAGHWWAPQHDVIHSAWGYAIPAIAAYIVFDIVWWKRPAVWFRYPLVPFLLGIPLGFTVWGQPY